MPRFIVMLAVAALAGTGSSLNAGPIAYTVEAIVSGSLGLTNFTNALLTVTVNGDTTTTHFNSQGQLLDSGPATATIAGLGAIQFTQNGTALDDMNGLGGSYRAGIAVVTGSVLDTNSNVFATYGLNTAIGPVVGTGQINPNVTFDTNEGTLHISSVAATSIFSATLGTPLNNLPGGTSSAPVFLFSSTPVGAVSGTIGGSGSTDYYSFNWAGGAFSASAAIAGANTGASYLFSEGVTGGCNSGGSATLNSADSFTGTVAIANLAPGQYCIGLDANNLNDPAFALTFNTPVAGVPEPSGFVLLWVGLGMIGVLRLRLMKLSREDS